MDLCELLADQVDAGQLDPGELVREVVRLRITFEAHSQFEEQFLRPILREADLFGAVRMDEVLAEHVREHRAMYGRLAPGITAELRLTIDTIRHHLETEEEHFISSHGHARGR